ncbi:MAG TPA: beta-propeller fold lactonase family protein [Candidatus Angelobacter sp.]|jgi:6-phosphogluconolactonase|nr:beta-propeller fold lactonase family protein [Candidatus Angelobacter sp.]HKT49326.1 beta-propeller fold lactonase family protein [Candidatus Angelobacter sp.]
MRARIFAALCVALMGLTGCIKGEKSFFYVTGPGTNEVFGFAIHGDGSLTALGTPNFTTGSRPAALAVHPPGDFFYIANSAGANITLLDINSGNGELVVPPTNSALPPVTPPNIFNAGTTPIAMAVAPNAPRLYVANRDSGDISVYLIDPNNGNLGLVTGSPFKVNPDPAAASPTNPQSIAISPNGGFLYTANPTQGTIAGFAIASDGSLTPVPGSPFAVGTAGTSPSFLAVHPGGSFLYAADPASNAVLGFAIGGNGAITPIAGSPFAAGLGTSALSMTPQGSFLYASNSGDNTVSGYSIDNSGALTQVSGSPFLTGGNVPGYVLATGSFVYVADQGTNDIAGFAIANTGTLTKVKGSPFSVAVSPTWLIASAVPQ